MSKLGHMVIKNRAALESTGDSPAREKVLDIIETTLQTLAAGAPLVKLGVPRTGERLGKHHCVLRM